jgi:murein DD-endopeptidase MepM/ murein hydrolase activator NlpD
MSYGEVEWIGGRGYLANQNEQSIGIRYGNVIVMYGHLVGGGPASHLAVGQAVQPGELVGYSGHPVGEPGNAHLHLEVRPVGATYWTVNPITYFDPDNAAEIEAKWESSSSFKPNYPPDYDSLSVQSFRGGQGSFWNNAVPESHIFTNEEYQWAIRHRVLDPDF